MDSGGEHEVTALLEELAAGDAAAWQDLLPLVYAQLREIADRCLGGSRQATLQPTDLVHELYGRFSGRTAPCWRNRAHFLAVASTAMRGILVDRARMRQAAKRGGDRHRTTLQGLPGDGAGEAVDLLDLDAALEELAALSERQARVVTFRVFGGLTMQEIADTLGVSLSTIESDWRLARAWLSVRLRED